MLDDDDDDDSLLLLEELELEELLELELELDELCELEEDDLRELELLVSLTSLAPLAAELPRTNSSELFLPSTDTVLRRTVSGFVQLVLLTPSSWYT